jgi:hypothetical protein
MTWRRAFWQPSMKSSCVIQAKVSAWFRTNYRSRLFCVGQRDWNWIICHDGFFANIQKKEVMGRLSFKRLPCVTMRALGLNRSSRLM